MFKKVSYLVVMALMMVATMVNAQVTTSALGGKVVADGEPVIGATIQATHVPSGTHYGTITNTEVVRRRVLAPAHCKQTQHVLGCNGNTNRTHINS